jgi:hypothetical protein
MEIGSRFVDLRVAMDVGRAGAGNIRRRGRGRQMGRVGRQRWAGNRRETHWLSSKSARPARKIWHRSSEFLKGILADCEK